MSNLFYIISLERSKRRGDFIFWCGGGAGYTRNLNEAGLFDQEYCDKRRHNKDLVFVPEGDLSEADTVRVVPLSVFKRLREETGLEV